MIYPAMHLTALDWSILALSLGVTFLPAIFLARRAGKNTAEFFAAGRQAPWWLIGISLVATTFSTDTPNLVTNFVRTGGVAANWQWWAFLLTGMATVFFYARLWRRSGVLTDLEFYELRYSGKAASFVRGFRAVYLGFFFNIMIIASVNLAAAKIASILFGLPEYVTLPAAGAVVIVFAATAGLWGVMVTDMFQFCITMSSAFAAAYFALRAPQVAAYGGLHGLFAHISQAHPHLLDILPDFSNWGVAAGIFVIPLTVQWWSVWYPGAEPGGGSYVAQRMLSARRESDSLWGTMLFQAAHYALRPWPWIVVAVASLAVYPTLADVHRAFPHVDTHLIGDDIAYPAMLVFLPAGWAGFMVAGLFAAYRSTLESHLNWGTSYLVHDLYRRFMRPDASEKHYVLAGRIVTALIMICAIGFTFVLDTAKETFTLILQIGAGTGLIYLLRWYWWRINAWTEVSAMAASFLVALIFFALGKTGHATPEYIALLFTVGITTVVWIAVTYLTPPVDEATLVKFYEKVRPAGAGWARVRAISGAPPSRDSLPNALLGWVLGLVAIYSALFGTGAFIYDRVWAGVVYTVLFAASTLWLVRLTSHAWQPEA
ncbi:MAG TPA: sodium:solute symporter family protein [Candidatus Baltobacteraceae bacterium]|nr:sodium:solute symporter family protein [Candidatus Baltobacteraceae bacterium]